MPPANVHRQRNPTPQPTQRLTDADILDVVEAAYEYGVWAADIVMINFDVVAPLSRVIAELRFRAESAT